MSIIAWIILGLLAGEYLSRFWVQLLRFLSIAFCLVEACKLSPLLYSLPNFVEKFLVKFCVVVNQLNQELKQHLVTIKGNDNPDLIIAVMV